VPARASAISATEVSPVPAPDAANTTKATTLQIALIVLGVVGFLYFARPVILPIFLACVGGMTLKPLIRWLSHWHIPPALSAAVVLSVLVGGVTIGFIQLGHPALAWMNEAPQHMTELRQRAQKTVSPRDALQPGGGCGERPGSNGGGKKGAGRGRTQNQPRTDHY
jgi:predicted PurR-regulated permease PerM